MRNNIVNILSAQHLIFKNRKKQVETSLKHPQHITDILKTALKVRLRQRLNGALTADLSLAIRRRR
jgi:hypothetical protein